MRGVERGEERSENTIIQNVSSNATNLSCSLPIISFTRRIQRYAVD
jgi:hypothetical protein